MAMDAGDTRYAKRALGCWLYRFQRRVLYLQRGEEHKFRLQQTLSSPRVRDKEAVWSPLGSRRDVYSCTKDESRDKSSIFETIITAEPHGADRSAECFCCCCRCIHSPPMNRSKYSAQVPYSNEPTVAYVHPPMERPMER